MVSSAPIPARPLALDPALFAAGPTTDRDGAAEREAFERRMGAAWPGVVRLVERLLAWPGSAAEVEDVAQEVFLAAWRGRGDFRGDARWTTWLHTIAVRRARNAARARGRRERWFGRLLPAAGLEAAEAPDAAGAGTGAGEGEHSAAVRDALGRLRHSDREVLVLRYLEELGPGEIGARLGLGRAAVDARLSRARARLRTLLGHGGARP